MKRFEISLPVRTYFVLVLASVILIVVDRLGWVGWVRGGIETALIPVEKSVYQVSLLFRSPIQTLRFWRTGAVRIADLERQVAELTVDATKIVALEEENEAMRRLLGAPLSPQWRFIPAPIIGREDRLLLGVGSKDGAQIGDSVVWDEVLVGMITEVTPRKSSVTLLNDSTSKIPVYIPLSGADGLLVGSFGSQMAMSEVLQSASITRGETVVTSGSFGPARGLIVGKTSEILSDETDVYQVILVEPILDLSQLQTLFVVKE